MVEGILTRIKRSSFFIELRFFISHLTTLREWYIKKRLKLIKKENELSGPINILDAGCGLGQYAYYMRKLFRDAYIDAVDIDSERVSDIEKIIELKKLKDVCLLHQDLFYFSAVDKYDLILCSTVLEYVSDDAKVVSNFYKAIKDSGVVVIYQPLEKTKSFFKKIFIKRKFLLGDKISQKQMPVVNRYRKEDVIHLMEDAGFSIEKIIMTHGFWGRIGSNIEQFFFRSNYFKFPFSVIYLFLIHPFALVLMLIDYLIPLKDGIGTLIVARKHSFP